MAEGVGGVGPGRVHDDRFVVMAGKQCSVPKPPSALSTAPPDRYRAPMDAGQHPLDGEQRLPQTRVARI